MTRDEYTRAAVEALLAAHAAGEDIGAFTAEVLCRAAAQLGSTERLLRNRSGSWEAADARHLMNGTVGTANEDLHLYREDGDSADTQST